MSLSKKVVGRLAALMFLTGGIVTVAGLVVPTPMPGHRAGLTLVAAAAIGIGTFAWVAPWERWGRGATLWLVPPALALVAVSDPIGGADPYTYGIYFFVVFAWLGICHPPWTAVKWSPLAAVAYLLPLLGPAHEPHAAASVFQVIPVSVLIGEALSRVPTQLRQAEIVDSQRVSKMRALLQATDVLARQTNPTSAAGAVAELGAELLGGQGGLILLIEERQLVARGAHRWPRLTASIRIQLRDDLDLASVLRNGRLVLTARPRRWASSPGGADPRSLLFLPLVGTSGILGVAVIALSHEVSELDPFSSYVARTFATQAGLAFERLSATTALVEASMKDELTGLGNRRAAVMALKRTRPGDDIVLLDLDRLKELNDRLGHGAGDDALRSFGSFLLHTLRTGDSAARYGGDEFVLVLRGADGNGSRTVERLARAWRATRPATTFTAGVCEVIPGRSSAEALGMADKALYRAKQAGRDRVLLHAG